MSPAGLSSALRRASGVSEEGSCARLSQAPACKQKTRALSPVSALRCAASAPRNSGYREDVRSCRAGQASEAARGTWAQGVFWRGRGLTHCPSPDRCQRGLHRGWRRRPALPIEGRTATHVSGRPRARTPAPCVTRSSCPGVEGRAARSGLRSRQRGGPLLWIPVFLLASCSLKKYSELHCPCVAIAHRRGSLLETKS